MTNQIPMQLQLFASPVRTNHGRNKHGRLRAFGQPAVTHASLWDEPVEAPKEDREMALLFLDIRDFTPLAGSFQASEIVHLIRKLLLTFQRIVRNYRGRIIETTGDGFYAAFGFHEGIEESVKNAVQAGAAILKSLESMNTTSFEKNLGRRIEAGIGVHAGKVALGNIRLGGEQHLMVMGHAVNIASRLQEATKAVNNNFLVSAYACAMAGAQDAPMMKIKMKGMDTDLDVKLMGKKYAPKEAYNRIATH